MGKKMRGETGSIRKFGMLDNIAYAAGDFGCNMSFALKGTMVIFWTQFMQMDSMIYAGLFLICQIWDAVNDPLIGSVIDADTHKYKRNKFLAYISAGSIGLLVAGALCFIPVPGASAMAKNIIFVAGYVCWDAFYTVANIPYGSLLGLISEDVGDRASLSAFRSVGAMIGQIATMVLLPVLIYDSNNELIGERVFVIALVMGFLGFLALQFMVRNTVIRVDTTVKVSEKKEKFNLFRAMGNFLKNRPALGTTLARMGMFLGMQGAAAAATVMFQSYFQNVRISGIIAMFSMLPIVLFTPFARKLVAKFGKKEVAAIGSLVCVGACLLMLVLPITPDGKGIAIYTVCQLINALGMGVFSTVCWAMTGDAIDYNEWKNNSREEGVVYSLNAFFCKLAQGAGPSLALVIMVTLGYVEANGGSQTFDVAVRMRYLVAALYLLSALMQFVGIGLINNLDKKTLAAMTAELDERRAREREKEEKL